MRVFARATLLGLAIVAVTQTPALAHEHRTVGNLGLTVGWIDEPALAGFKNAVQLIVTRSEAPVEGGRLEVELFFGDENSETTSGVMPLEPSFGVPGQYEATVIPSRPGQFTFHITGRVGGTRIDEFFTSGPDTFDDVHNPAESEFPAQDPTRAELAGRLDRLDSRVAEVLGEIRTLRDESGADTLTLVLAGAAAVLAALALAVALLRRSPRS